MFRRSLWVCSWLMFASPAWSAGSYSGEWEYQALNSGDTNFKVEHSGEKITFYRVLYPEFEGQRYKLEHIYRGKIRGKAISGEMFVREEGVKEFERLRDFLGRIKSEDKMLMDDMPLERVGGGPAAAAPAPKSSPEPKEPPPKPKEQTTDDPPTKRFDKVVIADGARREDKPEEKPAKPEPKAPVEHPKAKPPKAAPFVIPKLVRVNRKLATAISKRAATLLQEGDAHYKAKKYSLALEKYQAAWEIDRGKVELLYKLGLTNGILGNRAARKGLEVQAINHLQKAILFWKKAVRLDPYNHGAKENIRRAERRLAKLTEG